MRHRIEDCTHLCPRCGLRTEDDFALCLYCEDDLSRERAEREIDEQRGREVADELYWQEMTGESDPVEVEVAA